jgi:hypothetical protein
MLVSFSVWGGLQINIIQMDDPQAVELREKNEELSSKNKALLCEINSLRISRGRLSQELDIWDRTMQHQGRVGHLSCFTNFHRVALHRQPHTAVR